MKEPMSMSFIYCIVSLVAASLVDAAAGAYWPIAALIALGGFIGFCILLVRPSAATPGPRREA
jgi:uncharacterized RDD family membrane protein YckC